MNINSINGENVVANNVLPSCPNCGQRNGKKLDECGNCGHSLIRDGKGHSKPRQVLRRARGQRGQRRQRNNCRK